MDASIIGSSQAILGRVNDTSLSSFSRNLDLRICSLKTSSLNGCKLVQNPSFSVKASASSRTQSVVSGNGSRNQRTKANNAVELFVGLPLDTVTDSNAINHARAIAAGLKALKLLGVDGVELPVWWGIAEKEAMGKYDWTGYLALVEMVKKLGLKVHVSLCFHGSQEPKIPLPQWVSKIGKSDPDIYFRDRSGYQYKDCLSLSVDDISVLNGRTPLEVYREFMENFKSAFSQFFGSTITGLSIGLGPDGELRYPSQHHRVKNNHHPGAGEFQCYDKNMLDKLKHHAESQGNPLWGFSGPHDAPNYNQSPLSGGFFAENGGSWESPYGEFFLSWYSSQLALHGDRMLSLAVSIFQDTPIKLSGKLPLIHSWQNARSHPSELTAGFYNTANRNRYDVIAEIFGRNSCRMILPGMELSDKDVPSEYQSSPESLLAEITSSCRRHHVGVLGESENLPVSGKCNSFDQIRKNLVAENAVADTFMYQRMGAQFFSPDHFPAFAQLVQSFVQPRNRSLDDDLPVEDESLSSKDMHMQAIHN